MNNHRLQHKKLTKKVINYSCRNICFIFFRYWEREYATLTSKEVTTDYYKFFKTSVCENTDKTNSQPESFDEDVY